MVLIGTCPNCGRRYVGWSMQLPQNRICNKCDTELEIMNGVRKDVDHNSIKAINNSINEILNNRTIHNHGNKKNNNHEEDLG